VRLVVVTPMSVVVDEPAVAHVRAEDESGLFGVRPGHADFLTVLSIGVLGYRLPGGEERYVALRGGVLVTRGGDSVEVATREAVAGDDLAALEREVVTRLRGEAEAESSARRRATRLHLAALRQIHGYLRGDGRSMRLGAEAEEEAEEIARGG